MNENLKRTLNYLRNKQKRKVWLRAFRMWQRRPHEVRPLSDATHVCASCKDTYTGNFCPRCGQSARIGRFSFKAAFLLFLDVWGFGNRSMFRSLRDLILRPGYMIRDYLRGMQSAYFPPFKMFFVLAAISAIVEHGIFSIEPTETENREVIEVSAQGPVSQDSAGQLEKSQDENQRQMKQGVSDTMKAKINKEEKKQINQQMEKFIKTMNLLYDRNPAIFSLLMLVFFFLPLYLFFRKSPAIPNLRFSEFIIALVYSSNAYSIFSIPGKILSLKILNIMAVLTIFVAFKQFSGYSKLRLLGYLLLTFITSFVILVAAIVLIVIFLYQSNAPAS